jgi:hypothetical protein
MILPLFLFVSLSSALETQKLKADDYGGPIEWTTFNYLYVATSLFTAVSILVVDPVDHCSQLFARSIDMAGLIFVGNEG